MFDNINWERKITDNVHALFRSHGADSLRNVKKQQRLVEYCLKDIETHPKLKPLLLHSCDSMRNYILQCALECISED